MASINKKAPSAFDVKSLPDVRLAGGMGQRAAVQSNEALLRRLVMTCLLWEDIAYADGQEVAQSIRDLVPNVPAEVVAAMAVEARFEQKLRHVPLFLAHIMAGISSHKHVVADTLEKIINRPDELCEFLAIYWSKGKRPISSQIKLGLARAFRKFDEYQLAKWDKSGKTVSLSDVMRLVHPKPKDKEQSELWGRLLKKELATPQTWEVGLSAAKCMDEKRKVWVDLIESGKLPAFALLKNLRNMISVDVPKKLMIEAFERANPAMLLPVNFYTAKSYAPDYALHIEKLMYRCVSQYPKLPGSTIMVIDTSGSMNASISQFSEFSRIDVGIAMASLAVEICDDVSIYITAGSDMDRTHATLKIEPCRGFALFDRIKKEQSKIGHGGIFTKQCLDYIRTQETEDPDRIIVFSDSQDCDAHSNKLPKPFGKKNYIIDVSAHKHGVNYKGVWTAEISGWSEHFLKYVSCYEQSLQS